MESKHKRESDNEENKSCNIMTLDEKIKIPDKPRGGMRAAAAGLTFRWYLILKSNFPLILYKNTVWS
jgi:hypothetical protein